MVSGMTQVRWWDWRSQPLLRAFAWSLALHVALLSGIETGHRLGWWQPDSLPSWLRAAMHRQMVEALARMQREDAADAQRSMPLLFVDVDASQSSAEAPAQARYYSDKNSIAANPDVRIDSDLPNIDGAQAQVPKTADQPRSQAQPLQPALPPPEVADAQPVPPPETESRPSPQREPDADSDRPRGGQAAGDLAMAKPMPRPETAEPGAGLRMTPPPPPPPRARPRTISDALRQKGLLAGEKMQQEGGVRRRALMASLDVAATPFGAYDAAIIAAIQQRWYDLIDASELVQNRIGKVAIEFKLKSNGRVSDIDVVENEVGELLSLLCQRAIQDPAPFAPWPSDLRRMVGSDSRHVRFTFFYQ